MKKMMKLLTIVAAAAMGLTACQNGFEENDVNGVVKGSVVVKFVSEEARTSVDTTGDTPLFAWGEEETFAVLEQTDALAEATSVAYTNVDGKANIDAEFALNAGKDEYKYVAVYPEAGFVSADNINTAVLALPSEQSAVAGSYDPNADLMVSMPVATTEQPTESQQLRFTRLAAVAEMSINNLTLAAGEEVESVEFTANGKSLAGTIKANLEDPHAFTVEAGVSTVSVATTSANKVYFTLLPTTLVAGDTYSVAVATNKQVYIKQGEIPADKSLVFEAGKVSRFGVNMTDVVGMAAKWRLVRDASTLKEGDIVAIVAKDYDKALSTKLYSNASETSTTAKRDAADITKSGNYLVSTTDVQQLILMTGLADNTFSFYDEARQKFLVSTSTGSTYLCNQVYCNVDTSFAITINGATAAATITNTEGDYKGNLLRYNTNDYFTSNKNDSSVYKDVCVYRLEGAEGTIPTVDANIEVPDSDESIVITEDGVAEPTVIEEVVFNYVGNWNIKVEADKEWLDVVYDAAKNALTYTAEANVNPKRTAVVKITASLEGQESLTWTFNMLQKGAPVDCTIEEFAKLAKDENSSYRLTGKVTTEAGNATSTGYGLSDENGNTVTINYLKDENGNAIWGHNDISIKLGDVMTVVTVPAGSKKGGISNTYPSIYKGHYRLTATAGVAADYTGGAVAIEVATSHNGSIELPTTPVSGTMTPCDYATFSYDGGDTATVSFTSENTTSEAREATATFTYGLTSAKVTVQQGINPANKIGWELVTDASTLAVGDEIIIVTKNGNYALACPTKTNDTKLPSTTITKTGSVIYDIEEAGVQPFKLVAGASDGTMALEFSYKDTTYYPYYSSGIKLRTSINAAASWKIAIANDGDASISNSSSTSYLIKFNSAAASLTFTCYKDSAANATKTENLVSIYKKQVK